jgi:signal transduction histidine kinase
MRLGSVPRLSRRAILIYVGTIVVPVAGFLWLGLQSFERQRQVLIERTTQTLVTQLEERITVAGRAALESWPLTGLQSHPIVEHPFEIHGGVVVKPALTAPLPDPVPVELEQAQLEETANPGAALERYRARLTVTDRPALALLGIARSLEALGRGAEARETWRELSRRYPDERDLAHRPLGIVAAIQAGDTRGLFDRISAGRWDLSADHAAYFLDTLAPSRDSPFMARFAFARELAAKFPHRTLAEDDVYSSEIGARRVFYRSEAPDRIVGFSVNPRWVTDAERQLISDLDVAGPAQQGLAMYVGSVALILVLLSAGVVLILRDVSRESRVNRARAELVSSVSHELKTPVTLMRLYSETLLRGHGFAEEDRVGFYRIIARESTRLGRLIDQVLTFSRVDRGAQSYHLESGDVGMVVSGVVESYREYLEHAGFQLHYVVGTSLPPVPIDGEALSQALFNLLDNAVKYSGAARSITVRVRCDSEAIAIEVEDRGIGIPAVEQERIFERFYRVPNSSGKGGYGLGLFLVNHIVQAHGGRTEVVSEPGCGSCFRLILPVGAA